jgi:hypothetical protein
MSKERGKKDDMFKNRYELIPLYVLDDVADVLTQGALKYGADNWKILDNAKERYMGALLRHLSAYQKGDKVDKDSGKSHLAHAACNILFMLWFEQRDEEENGKG